MPTLKYISTARAEGKALALLQLAESASFSLLPIVYARQQRSRSDHAKILKGMNVNYVLEKKQGALGFIINILFGKSALIFPKNIDDALVLFGRVGEQAIATIYLVPDFTLDACKNKFIESAVKFEQFVEMQDVYLEYTIDEDGADSSGNVLEVISYGVALENTCPDLYSFLQNNRGQTAID